jgi:hypothetical protein
MSVRRRRFLKVTNHADGEPVLFENNARPNATLYETIARGNRIEVNFSGTLTNTPVEPGSVEVLYRTPESQVEVTRSRRSALDNGRGFIVSKHGDLVRGDTEKNFIDYASGEINLCFESGREPNSGVIAIRYRRAVNVALQIPKVTEAESEETEVESDDLVFADLRQKILADRGGLA